MNFEPACGLANEEGNWTVSGKLVLASEYRSFFKHQVEFRSGEFSDDTMCVADIDSCGLDPAPSDLDSCWCTKSKGNDFYVTMRRKARSHALRSHQRHKGKQSKTRKDTKRGGLREKDYKENEDEEKEQSRREEGT